MVAMTRAEGICACTNIIDIVEELSEKLPDQYSRSVHDKMQSMKDFIQNEWRSPNITEKMDRAIRNTWEGLRKWDRDNEHNDELFFGLGDAIGEVAQATATKVAEEKAAAPEQKAREAGKQGVETDQVDLSGLSPEELQRLEDMRARAEHANLAQKEQGRKKDLERAARATAPIPTNGIHYTDIVKERENLFAMVRTQFHEKGIRVVDVDDTGAGRCHWCDHPRDSHYYHGCIDRRTVL